MWFQWIKKGNNWKQTVSSTNTEQHSLNPDFLCLAWNIMITEIDADHSHKTKHELKSDLLLHNRFWLAQNNLSSALPNFGKKQTWGLSFDSGLTHFSFFFWLLFKFSHNFFQIWFFWHRQKNLNVPRVIGRWVFPTTVFSHSFWVKFSGLVTLMGGWFAWRSAISLFLSSAWAEE